MINLKQAILLFLIFLILPFMTVVNAASLSFDKATATVINGQTVQMSVMVTPGSDALSSVDAYVTYDATYLRVGTVTAGTLFPTVSHDESVSGKVYIAGMVNDPTNSVSTSGTVATITFTALKDGTTTLAYDCSTSKIIKNDINASDVMVCGQNTGAVLTIGVVSSGSNNSASIPTSAPASSNNSSTPASLPQSGIFDNVVKYALPGTIMMIIGSVLRLIL